MSPSIDLNNCGKLRIEARRSNDGPLQGAEFDITPNPSGRYGTSMSSTTAPMTATARPARSNRPPPGTYTVCETKAPAGYKRC
jgi:hypothetical protein